MTIKTIEPFKDVPNIDVQPLLGALATSLDSFAELTQIQVYDYFVYTQLCQILDQGNKFRDITVKSADESAKNITYCNKVIYEVKRLITQKVRGSDFVQSFKELLSLAQNCKMGADYMAYEYTNIHNVLNSLSENIKFRDTGIKQEQNNAKKETGSIRKKARKKMISMIGAGVATVGLGVLTVATFGAAAPITLPLAVGTAASARETYKANKKHDEYIDNKRYYQNEVNRLNISSSSISSIVQPTQDITKVIGLFQQFWQHQVNEITVFIQRFEHKIGGMHYCYNSLSGKPVIKQWEGIRAKYEWYEQCTRNLLNQGSVPQYISY